MATRHFTLAEMCVQQAQVGKVNVLDIRVSLHVDAQKILLGGRVAGQPFPEEIRGL